MCNFTSLIVFQLASVMKGKAMMHVIRGMDANGARIKAERESSVLAGLIGRLPGLPQNPGANELTSAPVCYKVAFNLLCTNLCNT